MDDAECGNDLHGPFETVEDMMKELHANLIHAQEERNKGYKGRNADEVLAEMDHILERNGSKDD
jgi:hypothetical protein